MRVIIERDYDSMSRRAASIVAELIRRQPDAVLGLATGSTPIGLYRELIRLHREEKLDFARLTTFNLDEYEGLPAGHPQSYHHFMKDHLFAHVNLKSKRTHLLDGLARDAARACAAYERRILKAGGIDLQLLGIGGDGHIGFNEPGSSLAGRTELVLLHPRTIADNGRFFDRLEDVPRRALSMGVGTILEARVCLILASGKNKAEAWARMIEGPISAQLPASALQLHPQVIALCDEAAAANLQHIDRYRHAAEVLADQSLLPANLKRKRARRRV
ncbi:MAG: glucosamine-6-phosphate deaminase [Gemmataceae bacterium]